MESNNEVKEVRLSLPNAGELEGAAQRMLKMAQSFTIDSPAMYDAAAEDLRSVKTKAKQLDEQRKVITVPLDNAKKAVMDLFRKPLEYLETAENVLKRAMLDYQREEKRKADERHRIAEDAARKERERLQAEAAAKAAEALKLAASGHDSAAEEAQAEALSIQAVATVVTAPPVESSTPKVSGISTTTSWKARVVDKQALIKHIAEHPECLDWVDVKMTPINQMAKALKANMRIPGVEAYPDEGLSARIA